ncbi:MULTISPECIES: RNA polymerase sigma factor [Butyricimonas]|uniref:RNA polymerase sigma factor n=1 Tax=Butyricimonas TaxID=574697 RepID=UPI00037CE286|nr:MULTISPECIES: sigma-70 family RNA polymerase sigma factor [Butyricimonas]
MVDIETSILRDLNKGKEGALKEIYRLFFHALCAFGSRFVKDDAAVADIVQEVFIKVWTRREKFEAIYSLRSFMYLSVRNACLNYNRDRSRVKKVSLNDTVSETFVEEEECFVIEEELHRRIRNEVERLPEAMRKVFNLTLLDMSITEIAEALDVSENTVRNQRARAREILRGKLKDKIFLLFLFYFVDVNSPD